MNPTDPLANLRDIHLPGEVSWWPLAPGWWLLITLLLAVILWQLWLWKKRIKHRRLLQEIQQELSSIKSSFDNTNDQHQLVSSSSELLRRLLLLHKNRSEVANLTGQNLNELLNSYVRDTNQNSNHLATLLSEGKFQRQVNLDDPQQFIYDINRYAMAIGNQIVLERINA